MSKSEWPRVRFRKVRGDWCIDLGRMEVVGADGSRSMKRKQIFRPTKELADAEAAAQRRRRKAMGTTAQHLTHAQMMDAVKALNLLEGRYSLEYASQFLVNHKPNSAAITVTEVFDDLMRTLESRESEGDVGHRHVMTTRSVLKQFLTDFSGEQVADITRERMRTWARDTVTGSPQTKANKIRHVHLFFAHALRNEYIVDSPMKGVRAPKQRHKTPEHHTVEQVAKILKVAAADPEHRVIVPRLAIGYFAGLRAAEQDKLTWAAIKFDAGIIAVSEVMAKCNVPRPVTISPNLMHWLMPFKGSIGRPGIGYHAFRRHLEPVLKKAGVEWIQNAMRHTFATHHYAYYQSADLTAKELGHMGSYRLLHRNYANSGITKDQASGYWDIEPDGYKRQEFALLLARQDRSA